MKLPKFIGRSLFAATFLGMSLTFVPVEGWAKTATMQQKDGTVKGNVVDEYGEPMFGAVAFVVGTTNSSPIDFDGNFELRNVEKGATIRVTLMGYKCDDQVWKGGALKFVMKEESTALDEVVVTAMGIMRKEKSLTYATQLIKADELLKAPDANIVNSLEGKISGITITPSAGGAGGASKILLRGNKSILGENSPLIVVDGVPMTNNVRNQKSGEDMRGGTGISEGSDPLSMINPDDIESMNVLKGANAAAIYGSRAANGVVMITTKKGKEGKMEVTFTSNTTFETPLLTPQLQNSYGGGKYYKNGDFQMNPTSWGDRLQGGGSYVKEVDKAENFNEAGKRNIYLRGTAADDIANLYSTGVMTNNSISVSGGTEKIQTYISYSNAYSQGMIETNKYSRNTFAFRQSYKLWDRLTIDASANYMQTGTKNRVGGGRTFNPIFDLYMANRDIDMAYYKDNYMIENGQWKSSANKDEYYQQKNIYDDNGELVSSYYEKVSGKYAILTGDMQNWALQTQRFNNPYWLLNKNFSESTEDRFYANFQANLKIIEGLHVQARLSFDHSKYTDEGGRYATTMSIEDMERYGTYWLNNNRTNELYMDYLLSYNKTFAQDWSVSASAGYVGHTIKGINQKYYAGKTTIIDANVRQNNITIGIPTQINIFYPLGTVDGVINSKDPSSNWDKAALATAQVGWKEKVYIDASYRQDWYRPFRQFKYLGTKESYGYFGFGANAVLSELIKMPKWLGYAKYRMSYSEVGNSIPNIVYNSASENLYTEAITTNPYATFTPIPETTKSFETGIETQLFDDCMNFDITYYNSAMHDSYITTTLLSGKTLPVNAGIIRNQGIEVTAGYDWALGHNWRWKTGVNFSYNHNKIEEIYNDPITGKSAILVSSIGENDIEIRYEKGGKYGDMYIRDYDRYKTDVVDKNGNLLHKEGDIKLTSAGALNSSGPNNKYMGNMNSDYQLSWSNTFTYKDFTLYFLINGRIGGKVVSLTERYLDSQGNSKRTGDAREYAENWVNPETGKQGLYIKNGKLISKEDGGTDHAMFINDGRDIISVKEYYTKSSMEDYIYDATNFRLRELSLGYTFRNLFGNYKNLNISFVCRNLFFLYREAPVDPDISVSTGNGLGGVDLFNYPSARSFGLNIKVNL